MLQVTQESLAELAGVSLRSLKQFESGKGNPTLRTITNIAEALGLKVTLEVKTPNVEDAASKGAI